MDTFITERLILRQLKEENAKEVLDYFQRNKEFLSEWEAGREDEFFTLDYQKKLLENDRKAFEDGQSYKLWILKKEDERKVIGCISFSVIVRGILQSSILGYKLDVEETNKGYISEALNKAIEIAFSHLKLHRLEAPIMPRNYASIKVVEKLGFCNEGL